MHTWILVCYELYWTYVFDCLLFIYLVAPLSLPYITELLLYFSPTPLYQIYAAFGLNRYIPVVTYSLFTSTFIESDTLYSILRV